MGVKKAISGVVVVLALSGVGYAQQATANWKPQGNVEFVVGAGAGWRAPSSACSPRSTWSIR
jgi:hypothetical protein